MLKHFHTFQTFNADDSPHTVALLCVGKTSSTALAYAWINTIHAMGELTVQHLEHSTHIPPYRVEESIKRLLDIPEDSPVDEASLLHQLYLHMITKGQERMLTRLKWFESQNRAYKTSYHATYDAAMASYPNFTNLDLRGQLLASREAIPYRRGLSVGLYEPKPRRTAVWKWTDYQEPLGLLQMLHEVCVEKPYHLHAGSSNAPVRLKKTFKKSQSRTPKARLAQLIDASCEYPHFKFRKEIDPKVIEWLDRNPNPLLDKDAQEMAKLPADDLLELLALNRSWVSKWYAFNLVIGNKTRDINREDLLEYTVEDGEMVSEVFQIDLFAQYKEFLGK